MQSKILHTLILFITRKMLNETIDIYYNINYNR